MEGILTTVQINELTADISLQYFYQPFRHQVTYNPRLKTTGGRYLLKTGNIEVNPRIQELLGLEGVVQVIKHELCHYHLHQSGKPSNHGSKEFKALLREVGGVRFIEWPIDEQKSLYHYSCMNCGQRYDRKRKLNTTRYVCGRCRGKLALLE